VTDVVDQGLLDTSVVINLAHLSAADLPATSFISAITLAELTVGPLIAQSDDDRIARQAVLQQTEAQFNPLPFDAEAARVFGRIAARLRRQGRKRKARAYDALIAATSVRYELPLFTCNPKDFDMIEGLEVHAVN